MLGQVNPTPYDLYFPLFGIPVRVTPWFWLVGVFTGWSTMQGDEPRPDWLLIWIACLFVSILVHEMGHALTAKAYGWPPQVFLYHFGGVAMFAPYSGYTPQRSILVSFAGPGAGFVLYGIVLAVEFALQSNGVAYNDQAGFALFQLKYINLYWGLVNLLPVLPLDGGQICREVCHLLRLRDPLAATYTVGIVVGGAAAAAFLLGREYLGIGYFPAILFGLLCFENLQMLQAHRGRSW
jgi:Zn-dependent protease